MGPIVATTHNRAGELALAIYKDVLEAISGDRLIKDSVKREGSILHVQDKQFDLDKFDRVFVCGCGKASFGMAKAVAEILGDRVSGGLVITKHGHGGEVAGIEVIEASHPVPDETSLEAGRRMLEFAAQTGPNDLVLFALSGGASALMESLVEGVSLSQLQKLNRSMLANGLNIHQMNEIRKHFSRIKGGKLGEAFAPSTVVVLVLDDVMMGGLETIGSGPFWNGASEERIPCGTGSYWEAKEPNYLHFPPRKGQPPTPARILFRNPKIASLFNQLEIDAADWDSSISSMHLQHVCHRFVGTSLTAVFAAWKSASELGLKARGPSRADPESGLVVVEHKGPAPIIDTVDDPWAELSRSTFGPNPIAEEMRPMMADTWHEAGRIVLVARLLETDGVDYAIIHGEPTVVIKGGGDGGRCQELACKAASGIAGMEGIAILAGSTDGTDGPTDVGAAIVDGDSVKRAAKKGVTAEKALEISDSQSFLAACDGLIYTGPTQSNVNDIVIVVRHLG